MSLPSSLRPLFPLLFLIVVALATALRVPDLTRRPMHTDEAVHAVKFGMLLEDGVYRYDRLEYHGPTLNYVTLVAAWLESAGRLSEVDETTLRVVPVAFGMGIVVLLVLLLPGLGRGSVLAAGFLTAVSPAMVFYSRYYIQEMLLVFFTFGLIVSGYRYARGRHVGWVVAGGMFLGLMHATKETAVLAVTAMVVALGITLAARNAGSRGPGGAGRAGTSRGGGRQGNAESGPDLGAGEAIPNRDLGAPFERAVLAKHGLLGLATAAIVSALFFSSFFSNPAGVVDSYTTYVNYVGRATQHDWHIQPWHHYVGMLAYFRGPSGQVWSEALILVLAGFGIFAAVTDRRVPGVDRDLLRFVASYGSVLLILYSAIPYKTPWSILGALHGLILVAGVGAVAAFTAARGRFVLVALVGVFLLGGGHLVRQSYLATHQYSADPSNPYVYSHPTDDVIRIGERVQAFADVHPDGNDLYIEVISPLSDYWPLPWYLRAFPNTGWWEQVDMDMPAAPLIIAAPDVEEAVLEKLYKVPPPGERYLYVPLFEAYTEIRPTVEIRGYVVKELWDAHQRQGGSS